MVRDDGEPTSLFEPLMIGETSPHRGPLNDLALTLAEKSASLRASLPASIAAALADLVRSMNCYYSNLIEGRNTKVSCMQASSFPEHEPQLSDIGGCLRAPSPALDSPLSGRQRSRRTPHVIRHVAQHPRHTRPLVRGTRPRPRGAHLQKPSLGVRQPSGMPGLFPAG